MAAGALASLSGSLDPQGPASRAMADLWWLMLALGTVIFAIVVALLVVGLLRRPREDAGVEEQAHLGRWIVGGGVVMPAIVLAVVFAATIAAMRSIPTQGPQDALIVEITGHQWWYEVAYPAQGITTRDELRIPVGRPVELRLMSADVIHSFWVPELGGKLDMLPDGTNTLVLQADEAGEHIARCAEFCGLQHAKMQMTVVAEAPDAFDAWVAARQ